MCKFSVENIADSDDSFFLKTMFADATFASLVLFPYCILFMTCILLGQGFYLAIGGVITEYGFGHINNIIQDRRFNCRLVDVSDDMAMISVQGPKRSDFTKRMSIISLVTELNASIIDRSASYIKLRILLCTAFHCSRDILQSVIEVDLSDANFPFSTHKVQHHFTFL
jgi:hypothetical protein